MGHQIFVYTLLVLHEEPYVGVFNTHEEAVKVGREIQADIQAIKGENIKAYVQRHRVPLNDEVEYYVS